MRNKFNFYLEDLKQAAELAERRAKLLQEANELRSNIINTLSNFACDVDKEETDPEKIVSAFFVETLDDHGCPYEGFEALSSALATEFAGRKSGELREAVIKQIIDDRWYSSDEYYAEQAAYDEAVFGS